MYSFSRSSKSCLLATVFTVGSVGCSEPTDSDILGSSGSDAGQDSDEATCSLSSELGDSESMITLKNETEVPLYVPSLGPYKNPYWLTDDAGEDLPITIPADTCLPSCMDISLTGCPGGVPPYSATALQPGESVVRPWQGVYLKVNELPESCWEETGSKPKCVQSLLIPEGWLVHALAVPATNCSDDIQDCGCESSGECESQDDTCEIPLDVDDQCVVSSRTAVEAVLASFEVQGEFPEDGYSLVFK